MNFQWRRAQCHFGNYRPPIETGANWVAETYPFPALLSVFSSRRFAMPSRRCLLNETAAIIGTGHRRNYGTQSQLEVICDETYTYETYSECR